jgi:hypothetical protein
MSALDALIDGLRRVQRAPALIAGVWLTTLLLAWPLALVLRGTIGASLGSSMAAESVAAGVNYDWWNEFLAQAGGLGQTFVPAILGFAAVIKNISSMADLQPVPSAIAFALAAHVAVSLFLLGGILDRLARDHHTGSYGFFALCGAFFFRFLRLFAIAGTVYWLLFSSLHAWLFDSWYSWLTRDVTVERTAIVYRAALYVVFALAVMMVNLVFDYAKIRMVVEDRRSAIGALVSALRFVRRHFSTAAALYLLNVLAFLAVLAIYAVVAPGASGGIAAWIGFLISQLYITLRIVVRLLFAASQIALFQSRLAHAGYVATRVPVWPDSPAVDAVSPQ